MLRAENPSTPPARGLERAVVRVAAFVSAAFNLARGYALSDAVSDEGLRGTFGPLPAALRAMRATTIAIPVAATALDAVDLVKPSLFRFTPHDDIVLLILVAFGIAVATVSYRKPRLTVVAFNALWNLRPPAWGAYLAVLLVPAAIFDSVFLGRVFIGILLLPVVAAMWMMYRQFASAPFLARFFPLAFAIMAAVPGFILPPYYQGIGGWTMSVDPSETTTLYGYRLVNDKGDSIWLTHTIFTPITLDYRFRYAWDDKVDKIGRIEPFIMKAYTRAYPLLIEGYMPHQRILGHFAYPPHTYAVNLPDHSEFPPGRIRFIRYVAMTYDQSDHLVDTKIISEYAFPPDGAEGS